jgi:hypothetical protein
MPIFPASKPLQPCHPFFHHFAFFPRALLSKPLPLPLSRRFPSRRLQNPRKILTFFFPAKNSPPSTHHTPPTHIHLLPQLFDARSSARFPHFNFYLFIVIAPVLASLPPNSPFPPFRRFVWPRFALFALTFLVYHQSSHLSPSNLPDLPLSFVPMKRVEKNHQFTRFVCAKRSCFQ